LKTKVIIVVLVLILIGGVYWGLDSAQKAKSKVTNGASSNISQNVTKENNQPIIDDQGGLQVSAEWLKQEGPSTQQLFSLSLNNHAVNVDNFQFENNINVLLDKKEIPIKVEVLKKDGSGHHVSAELKIESPEFTKAVPGSLLTLSVKNVYNTPTRSFTWKF
jgi:regulatory protein YycI of two-component signal transduction system YycFG